MDYLDLAVQAVLVPAVV